VLEAAELRIQAEINNVINAVVTEIIMQHNVTAADFLIQHSMGENIKPVLSVNTVLVNEICNAAAQKISERLNNLEPEVVSIPMGMALGLDTLAQSGPRFTFNLAPIGNALVNYESSFTAVGINQTHFAVWLTVESVVRIIKLIHGIHHTHRKPACNACTIAFFGGTDKPKIQSKLNCFIFVSILWCAVCPIFPKTIMLCL